MAYFKAQKKAINEKWYPKAITVGKPVTMDQVADKLSELSTVTRGDAYAVTKNLGIVLATYMANGRSVKIDGVGTFLYSATAKGNGVDTAEEVNAKQIVATRIRFIPETTRTTNGTVVTRSLISDELFWEKLDVSDNEKDTDTDTDNGSDTGDEEVNPLG